MVAAWVRVVGLGVSIAVMAGCSANLPSSAQYPQAHEEAAIRAAIQSWQLSGLPWSKTCSAEFARIRVVVSPPDEFTELCGRAPVNGGGKLYACSTEQYALQFPAMLFDSGRVPLLVISQLQPEPHRRLLIIHESMHWLERCSDKGIDYHHEDVRVWQSARHVAQRIMLDDHVIERYARSHREFGSGEVARK